MSQRLDQRIRIVDTHAGGEPTRIVVAGGPELGSGSMIDRRRRFATGFDEWRRAIVCEPRGSDVMVGAILTPPERADSIAGVIFFNNVGYLGMCGHGTIGVAIALQNLGRASPGRHALDTPAGQVWFELLDEQRVRVSNVPSYRYRSEVCIELPCGRSVTGDIAWGGNWFYLCGEPDLPITLSNLTELMKLTTDIRQQLAFHGITGRDGAEIDHIELIGPCVISEAADARNFVLCPGGAYDRSPCGTGTSAKVACLAASGQLEPGQIWRQASVIGSIFEATYEHIQPLRDRDDDQLPTGAVRVSLVGSAYITAEADLILDPRDPFCMGIRV